MEALEVLEEDDEFSFILMDTKMPKLNGYDTIRHIRAQERFQKLVIIALISQADGDDHKVCLEAGANDTVIVPIAADALWQVMKKHLPQPCVATDRI